MRDYSICDEASTQDRAKHLWVLELIGNHLSGHPKLRIGTPARIKRPGRLADLGSGVGLLQARRLGSARRPCWRWRSSRWRVGSRLGASTRGLGSSGSTAAAAAAAAQELQEDEPCREPRLTAAIPMDNLRCICKLTRVPAEPRRRGTGSASTGRLWRFAGPPRVISLCSNHGPPSVTMASIIRFVGRGFAGPPASSVHVAIVDCRQW